jgi:hypothetical protein
MRTLPPSPGDKKARKKWTPTLLRLDRLSASPARDKMGLSPRIYWITKNTYYKQVYWLYKYLSEISVCEFFYIYQEQILF